EIGRGFRSGSGPAPCRTNSTIASAAPHNYAKSASRRIAKASWAASSARSKSPKMRLAKLSRYLGGMGLAVSPAHLGRILARNGGSLQRTRSWKQSPDPDYRAKAARILPLYREKPENGVVISFDEKGPESRCP